MSDFPAIADRVQIEALRGEATDAAMMRDHDRVASLFTHDGVVRVPHIGADAASGRACISELVHFSDGRSELNYAIYHYHYRRTGDGWKFTERIYEVRYLDHSPLAGSAPRRGVPADPPATGVTASPGSSSRAVMAEEVR